MRPIPFWVHGLFSMFAVFASGTTAAQDITLEATLDQLVQEGRLIAAQAVVGRGNRILVDYAVGMTSPGGDQEVNSETLFCIGSCSKPFASSVVMSLVEDGVLELKQPASKYIPAMGQLKLPDGKRAERAPTIEELLAHRAGVYSQKTGMTKRQAGWIRNFHLTLEESVQGISVEPLISPPGSEYAYSGAGYCAVGRIAEIAAGRSFEQLLQSRIAAPLELKRTTYFPDANDDNIAAGGKAGVANPATPHLSKPALRLALIGGSLYSTAQETGRFLRMVAQAGKIDENTVMNRRTWETWTSRPYPEGSYGLGWMLNGSKVKERASVLSHNGSLASSRSIMVVSLDTCEYSAVHFTVVGNDKSTGVTIRKAMERAMLSGPSQP